MYLVGWGFTIRGWREDVILCGLMGDFSPAGYCLPLSPSPFSYPPLHLLSPAGDQRIEMWRQALASFLPSQSCQCGKGGHDHAIGEKADTLITDTPSHALCPEPHLMWNQIQPSTQWMQESHTLWYLPSHRGYRVTGTGQQSLLVTLALVTTCWPQRDR